MASCTYAGQTSTFTYGADGLRRRMVTGANTTDYLLDGQSVVREIKNGVINATYLNGPRGPEYKRDQNGAVQWYLYDGLGSVVGLVDSSGNVTNTRKYDVYGAPRNAQTGSAHCFVGSLGHTSDAETGLIYMRARYYDPATGRFVSEDPEGNRWNWYVYASGDPINRADPDGCFDPLYDAAAACALLAAAMFTKAAGAGALKMPYKMLVSAGFVILAGAFAGFAPSLEDKIVIAAIAAAAKDWATTPVDPPKSGPGGIVGPCLLIIAARATIEGLYAMTTDLG